jgi:hypothetical protein
MRTRRITTVGAWCAILMFPVLIIGGVLLSSSGAADLLPPTGKPGREWLFAVAGDNGLFAAGAWLLILMGFLAMVAFVGFYYALRQAGPILVLAPILGVAGMTLVQVSHLIPIGIAYELAPAYANPGAAQRATLGVVSDTLAAASLVINAAGDALVWGLAVPLFAWAILTTRLLPRWIGWLGLVVAVFAGWLGLIAPASNVVEGISNVGFPAFFIFMLSVGICVLRRQSREDGEQPLAPSEGTHPAHRRHEVDDASAGPRGRNSGCE